MLLVFETVLAGIYPGTLFRFPLRNTASDLSENLYTIQKLQELFQILGFQIQSSAASMEFDSNSSLKLTVRHARQDCSSIIMLCNQSQPMHIMGSLLHYAFGVIWFVKGKPTYCHANMDYGS